MEQGFSLAWMGWQWDVPEQPGLLRLRAPIATSGGRPIEGLVRSVVIVGERKAEAPLGDSRPPRVPGRRPRRPGQPPLPSATTASTRRGSLPRKTLALRRAVEGRPRRRLRAGAHLRGRLPQPRPARRRLRLRRHARPRQLLQERARPAEPARRRHARRGPRHLAERPLPPPLPPPGLQRGRAGPPRLRRRLRRGGRRRARLVQPPLRAGLARRPPALERPLPDRRLPVHRPARDRPRDRRDGRPPRPRDRERHGAEALPRGDLLRVLEPGGVADAHRRRPARGTWRSPTRAAST